MTETTDKWSPGGQIFYSHGMAWGTTSKLRGVCIGTEEEVTKALNDKTSLGNSVADNILRAERNNS